MGKTRKYLKQPTESDRESITIEIHKKGKKVTGFTVWAGKFWVLDGSILLHKDEEKMRVYTGNRIQDLQFEYVESQSSLDNYLELRRK